MRTSLFIFIALVCGAKSFENDAKLSSSNFFIRCDSNKDKSLTIDEIRGCITQYGDSEDLDAVLNSDGSKFLSLIDKNRDNKVTLKEYISFIDTQKDGTKHSSNDGRVTVKTRDGKVKDMTRDEMQAKMTDSMKGFTKKDDKMFKEDTTSGKIDEIMKKNPEMGRFIQLGNWCFNTLQRLEYVTNSSKIVNLKSLPDGGLEPTVSNKGDSKAASTEPPLMSFKSNFTAWLILSTEDKETKKLSHHELKVHYDPSLYRKPYLHILSGHTLNSAKDKRVNELVLPEPRIISTSLLDTLTASLHRIWNHLNTTYGQYTMLFYSVLGFLAFILTTFWVLYTCCLSSIEPDPIDPSTVDGEGDGHVVNSFGVKLEFNVQNKPPKEGEQRGGALERNSVYLISNGVRLDELSSPTRKEKSKMGSHKGSKKVN